MSASPLVVVKARGTATLRLSRPDRGNSIDRQMAKELESAIAELAGDASIAVALVEAEGPHFCTGGDVTEYGRLERDELREQFERMTRVCAAIEALPMPVIAALSGPAVGGGVELALACDLRVASAESWLQFPNVRLGVATAWGGAGRLADRVGRARALELLLTGRRIAAPEAGRIGLVDLVVDDARAAARDLARLIELAPVAAVHAAKRDVARKGLVSIDHSSGAEELLDLWFSIGRIRKGGVIGGEAGASAVGNK